MGCLAVINDLSYHPFVRRDFKTWLFGEEKDFSAYLENPEADIWRDWLSLSRHQRLAQEIRRQLSYRLSYRLRHIPDDLRRRAEDGPRGFLPSSVESALQEREIDKSKKLIYRSSYVHTIDEECYVEGYFELKKGSYSLSVSACGAEITEIEEAWACGKVSRGGGWESQIIVPGDVLNDEIIAEAIRRWYMERIEWKRSLWSRAGRCQLPEIVIDLAWEKAKKKGTFQLLHHLPVTLLKQFAKEKKQLFERFGRHDEGPDPIRRD